MQKIALFLLTFYKKALSPFLGGACTFYPSCSDYSVQAFEKYGFLKGFLLTIKRVVRCVPGKYTHDPLE